MSTVDQQPRPSHADLERCRTMRDTTPVWRDAEADAWHVYRYQDVARVLADAGTFSSDFGEAFPDRAELTEGNIVAMDPPRHDQLRGLVSQAFTPRAVARLEGRIAELANELLDRLQGQSHMELVRDLAYPLPVTVIAELLGIPADDRPRFKRWADALLDQSNGYPRSDAAVATATKQIRNFHEYLRDHVARRRTAPREDMLSDLVAAEIDGQRLSDAEIVGFATVLLIAGHITTTLLLGNVLLCLDEHPQVQSTLRGCPTAIPAALEEVLRYRSPVPFTARVTRVDVQFGDRVIPSKQLVYVWLLSANHDERRFENPDEFVFDRNPNPHLAFGKGIHFCLGAPLARLEARVVLGTLLRRFSRIRVDPHQPAESYARFNGPRTLHLLIERS